MWAGEESARVVHTYVGICPELGANVREEVYQAGGGKRARYIARIVPLMCRCRIPKVVFATGSIRL